MLKKIVDENERRKISRMEEKYIDFKRYNKDNLSNNLTEEELSDDTVHQF